MFWSTLDYKRLAKYDQIPWAALLTSCFVQVLAKTLIVEPFEHPAMQNSTSMYWRARKTLLIGHRGSGSRVAAAKTPEKVYRTHVRENTVLSFVTASSLGAEYVEFDVQLTSDNVCVIYHNFTVDVQGCQIPINRLTLEQFKSLRADDDSSRREKPKLTRAWSDTDLTKPSSHQRASSNAWVQAPLATLKETFELSPSLLGFNVEIKYPLDLKENSHLVPEDTNHFVDTILQSVFDHAGDRPIIFSSFHPEVCRLVALKQAQYPVLFLTTSGDHMPADNRDPRIASLRGAVQWATKNNLMGVVAKSRALLLCPELIREVKRRGLVLLTWGPDNNDVSNAKAQQNLGVDGVIADHIAHIRRGLTNQD